MLAAGAINALFMTPHTEWFENLITPDISPYAHSLLWLVFYIVIAIISAEFLIEKKLRKRIFCIVLLLIGNAVWCAVFFRLNSALVSFFILLALLADLIYILVLTVKNTRAVCFFATALLCWYIYLTGLNLLIVILN